jgi:replication factor A1
MGSIKIKSDSSEREKRTITIMDETGYSVAVTLWGQAASIKGLSLDNIIALKNCRVSDY